MIRLFPFLVLSLLFSDVGQAQKTVDEIHLRGTVQDVVLLSHFKGKITPVDIDPKFALAVRVESVVPEDRNFPAGAIVAFAIHSPALLFGDVKKGKVYDFSLQREIKQGKTRYFRLMAVKLPD